jgi:hypothetical protein
MVRRPRVNAAFYCVVSRPYFLGAVGLVNSLRLLGHSEPIHAMDFGLAPEQREALAPHVELSEAPAGREPYTLKPVLPLEHPADVMVLLDSDMIVTRPLVQLIAEAARGRVVAFENNVQRSVPEWGPLLELGPIERRPYLCSGCVAIGRDPGEEVLGLLEDRQRRVDLDRSYFGRHEDDYPLLYADQDVLNAILASRVAAERVVAMDLRLAPMIPFEGLEVSDERSLRCSYADGTEPFLVHHSLSPKPWQRPAYDGVYSRLLRRLLNGPDVAVRVRERDIPLGLRAGGLSAVERLRVKARDQIRWRLDGLRERLP